MRVLFKKNIKSYSGENDELVYQAFRKGWVCIGRDYVVPKTTTHSQHIGAIIKNLSTVFKDSTAGYKADLQDYAGRNGQEHVGRYALIPSGYALFIRMMFAWQKSDPAHVDLTAVTIADIVSSDADVRTIARAVGAGFLDAVSEYTDLNADISV